MPSKLTKSQREFIKKYAASMANVTGDGVWSGRGIAIPAGGAIFGGDDYKQKIGREIIPWWLEDFRGGPSMAADAGFSSMSLSRVYKDRDYLFDPKPMFPDQDVQEGEEDNNYYSESYSADLRKMKDVKEEYFNEDRIVPISKYSLSNASIKNINEFKNDFGWDDFVPDSLEDKITDANWRTFVPDPLEDEVEQAYKRVKALLSSAKEKGITAYEEMSDRVEELKDDSKSAAVVVKVAKEIGRDFVALTVAGIPILGTPIAASYVVYNITELQQNQVEAMRYADLLMVNGSQNDIDNLSRISEEMFDDYIDMLQAAILLIPLVGTTRGIIGSANKLLGITKATSGLSFFGLAGGSSLKAAVRSEIILSPVFKFVAKLAESNVASKFNIDRSQFVEVVYGAPATLVIIADLLDMANIQLEQWEQKGRHGHFKFDPRKADIPIETVYGASKRHEIDDYHTLLEDWLIKNVNEIKSDVLDILKIEGNQMNKDEKILRQFIRETVYHDVQAMNKPMPAGFEYRSPRRAVDYPEPDTETDYNYDVVNVKTDMGSMGYQSRPEDLREIALRRIIRRKIKAMSENKKKN